jgi:hypothetical protein
MVYNSQNYWVLGLRPSSGILETRKHNVWKTGFVSVRRRGKGRHLLSWVLSLRTETNPVSETFCSLVPKIPDDGQSPRIQ